MSRISITAAAASPPRFGLSEGSVELNFEVDESGNLNFVVAGEKGRTNTQTIKMNLVPA